MYVHTQGVLGSPAEFRRHYEAPILAGREPGAPPEVLALGEDRSAQLSATVNAFILRRTNTLLSEHLPPKVRFLTGSCKRSYTDRHDDPTEVEVLFVIVDLACRDIKVNRCT